VDIPLGVAGAVTIASLVAFGVFLYPWLLARRGGGWAVAAGTVLLAALFYSFERPGAAAASTSIALAIVWAVLPAVIALIVDRVRRRRA
jgi:uncharacterized membrane protein